MQSKCLVCGKQIGENDRALWLPSGEVLCMGCEFAEITVYHVTLPDEQTGYYETNLSAITEMIADAEFDSVFTVLKRKMKATTYYSLPEFTGF